MGKLEALAEYINDREQKRPLVLLLGAGASISSGAPSLTELQRAFLKDGQGEGKVDTMSPAALNRKFNLKLRGSEICGRALLFEKHFRHLYPSVGYVYLAKLLEHVFGRGRLKAVLTTNFDYLVEASLAKFTALLPGRDYSVMSLTDKALKPVLEDKGCFPIIKIYGDYFRKSLAFTAPETTLRSPAASTITELAKEHLLILGYSGKDHVFTSLDSSRDSSSPVWWVDPEKEVFHDLVEGFLEVRNLNQNQEAENYISGEKLVLTIFVVTWPKRFWSLENSA